MSLFILPAAEAHFEGLYRALDTVAKERRYLAFLQAPPREAAFEFFRHILDQGLCQVVAVEEGEVLGWCDVLPVFGDTRAHVGTLGMGLIPPARNRGVGRQLLGAAIAGAWQRGMSRIELTVRTDNLPAIALYERAGFSIEGRLRRAVKVGDEYFDAHLMALLR